MLLTDLIAAEVVDQDGNSLGHVHDVRARRLQRRSPDGHQLRVIALVVGRRGVRERLRLDAAGRRAPVGSGDVIDWDDVVEVDGPAGRVTVRRRR